jgi:ribosomal protein L22
MEEQTNNSRGGQPGNNNASKNKPFLDAMRRALAQNPQKIAKIVDKVLDQAEAGEAWAVKEVADRLDGKAIAIQEIQGPNGAELKTGVVITFVEPDGTITTD